MIYHGPLYGKIIGKYIELKYHSEDVDKLEADLKSQRQLVKELNEKMLDWKSREGTACAQRNVLAKRLGSQRQLAGELIAAIRANCAAGTLVTSDYQLIEEWLQPFIEQLIPYEAPTVREE